MKRKLNVSRSLLLRIYGSLRQEFGHRHWWPGETPLEVCVGAILTQNTAWANVEKAINNLKQARALSVTTLHQMSHKRLARLIRPAGYFNVKTKRLKNFIGFVVTRYHGNLGRMFSETLRKLRAELLSVSGIGNETADSILLYAGQKRSFVVDAYTRRIFSRHHFFGKTAPYEDIQAFFTQTLPQKAALFNDYHAQLVECAKRYCRTIPRCASCPLRFLFDLEK